MDPHSTAWGNLIGEGVEPPPLHGLILTGGRSRRMNEDKALLQYNGKPHLEYLFSLLRPHCGDVWISARAEQAEAGERTQYPRIFDSWGDIGPIGGILSAFREHPGAAWLVLACDMPFLDFNTIRQLVFSRNPHVLATCYLSIDDSNPEPLCAIYEPRAYETLMRAVRSGNRSPRNILERSSIQGVVPASHKTLNQVNTPHEYRRAVELLAEQNLS
jgi:molybdopterin-guanine dinucleotide biosynthesis protein A